MPVFRVVCFCFSLFVISMQSSAQDTTLIKNVRVFDGERIISQTQVLIKDGTIAEIGKEINPPAESITIDGTGHTLIPGLIDCHTHTFFAGHLQQAAIFGVTTELDMMSMPASSRAFRQQQKDGSANDRADLYSAGAAVTVDKGHGTQFGFAVPTLAKAEDAPAFVEARIQEGSDYIKIIHEDGSAYGMDLPTLSPQMLTAAIKACREKNKLAVAHIGSKKGARMAITNGINGLVHLFAEEKIDSALINSAKEKGVFVVPTAVVTSNVFGASDATETIIKDKSLAPYLTTANCDNLEKTFPVRAGMKATAANLKYNIIQMHRAGIPILVGTDAPNPGTVHGASMHHELAKLVESGLSPIEALAGATAKPAEHFGLKDRGRIAKGLRADLLLVKGDPSKDIKATRNIVSVWKAGHPIDRSSREKMVKAELEAQKNVKPTTSENKMISDFETGEVAASLGAGWTVSTDAIMGGSSTAKMEVATGGANQSKMAMKLTGDVREQQPAFSGAMFSPASTPMQPHNLSAYGGITVWAKNGGQTDLPLQMMLFTKKGGFQPAMKSFNASSNWKKYSFKFKDFNGSDGSDITGIWVGTNMSGDYSFWVDEFELVK